MAVNILHRFGFDDNKKGSLFDINVNLPISPPSILVQLWSNSRIHSWDKPVLSKEGKVFYTKKKTMSFSLGFKLMADLLWVRHTTSCRTSTTKLMSLPLFPKSIRFIQVGFVCDWTHVGKLLSCKISIPI